MTKAKITDTPAPAPTESKSKTKRAAAQKAAPAPAPAAKPAKAATKAPAKAAKPTKAAKPAKAPKSEGTIPEPKAAKKAAKAPKAPKADAAQTEAPKTTGGSHGKGAKRDADGMLERMRTRLLVESDRLVNTAASTEKTDPKKAKLVQKVNTKILAAVAEIPYSA